MRVDSDGNNIIYHGIFKRTKGELNWYSIHSIDDLSVVAQGLAAIFFCYVSHQLVFPLTQDLKNPTKKRLSKIFFRAHLT